MLTDADSNKGERIASGISTLYLCTLSYLGQIIRCFLKYHTTQCSYVLICRNTKEKHTLWRAYLFSGRLSFLSLEQSPVGKHQNIRRYHYVCWWGGEWDDIPSTLWNLLLRFLLGNTLKKHEI